MNLLALTFEQVLAFFQERYQRGHFHAAAFYRAAFQQAGVQATDLPAFSSNPELARRVGQDLTVELPEIIKTQSRQDVTKLALRLSDGATVETVVLHMPRHVTVCVSSQVGCRMACRFCVTGQMGLVRQLSAAEIVAQVFLARVVLGYPVQNVVFMGMGEPLDNWDQVAQAIRVLTDQRGLDIAQRRITVSTIGLPIGLTYLTDPLWSKLGIALSLNASDDAMRHYLMPATRSVALDDVKTLIQTLGSTKGKVFLIAYVLIKDVNDGEEHAGRLAAFLAGLPVKVNLIPFNSGEHPTFQSPSAERVEAFRKILVAAGVFVRLRSTKGDDIQAACGQLGGAVTKEASGRCDHFQN